MKRLLFALCAAACLLLCSSCSGVIGYSVVLWTIPEYGLADGTVLPVYGKSNISQVYFIKAPEEDRKVEVPLWMLSEPDKKSRALKTAQLHKAYLHKYAVCTFDGLPIRAEARNSSKLVYRLHKDEVIRTLYKTDKGVMPTSGAQNLEGDWLRVLTKDGTEGWCFSQNLRLFSMNADGSYGEGAVEAQVQQSDPTLDALLRTFWYPDYYSQMITQGHIELEYIDPFYGFDTGSSTGEISLRLPKLEVSYPYAGVSRQGNNVYRFNETPIQVTVRNESAISLQYTDESGKPKSYAFVTLGEGIDISKLISSEWERRDAVYSMLRNFGPDFVSSNYGTLSLQMNNVFMWHDYDLLVPRVIDAQAEGLGTVAIKYFLPQNLSTDWDGVLTFGFNGMTREVNLLYKKEANGLRLALANVTLTPDPLRGKDTVTVSQPASSLVMFFSTTVAGSF